MDGGEILCVGEHVRFAVNVKRLKGNFGGVRLTFNGLVIVTVSIVVIGGTAIVA